MENILSKAIESAQNAQVAFSKFIRANDTNATGAHQAGYHLHKKSWPLYFDSPGQKGENKDIHVTIRWQGEFETESRFIYYGQGTRDEYRLTRFGKGFPYLDESCTGDLLIISKKGPKYYEAFILHSDEDIEDFFSALNISPTGTNAIIPKQNQQTAEDLLLACFVRYLNSLKTDFPATTELASQARQCFNSAYGITENIIQSNPDREILHWLNTEYELFRTIENDRYSKRIRVPFESVEELVETANTILNRRKSRAGKSLEHHLAEIFKISGLRFASQAITEDRKKPDFIFPGEDEYRNSRYDERKLFVLAAKTTCKDRWRQVLNEADRVKTKHLFTLQQGISKSQLAEMYRYNVCLVVPKENILSFPKEYQPYILNLHGFLRTVSASQS